MSSDVLEHALEKIDAEILVLQERNRSLRSSRNALVSIHRLPPEVMTQIFKWYQSSHGTWMDMPSRPGGKAFQKWLQVTQVSQRWRNIARRYKALYSTIPTLDAEYARAMLEASGDTPLSIMDCTGITIKGPHGWDKDMEEFVVTVLPRVRNLCLGPDNEKFLLPHLESSRADLEGLSIGHWKNVSRTICPDSLRLLHLRCCPMRSIEWLTGLSNMVWLSLTSWSYDSYYRTTTVGAILNILDGMPQLTTLELSDMFQLASPEVARTSPTIAKLQYLKLDDKLEPVVKLLPWLTFAARFTVELRLYASDKTGSTPDLPPLLTQLGRHLRASSMVLRTADFSWHGAFTEISCSERAGESPCLHLEIISLDGEPLQSWIPTAEELPLDSIEVLTTDSILGAAQWKDSRWHTIRTLRQLTLRDDRASSAYLEHLVALGAEPYRSRGGMPFASLKELSLHGLHYGRDLKSKVQGVLTERMKRGRSFKLDKLTFHGCKVSEDSIRQLSKVVGVVEQHVSEKKRAKQDKEAS